jgi:uncharacterized protein YodC (DUF2158 family)
MEFKPSDLVRLKSGGPLMTVEKVGQTAMTQEEAVWCVWFEKVGNKQVVQRDSFAPVLLEKSEKPSVAAFYVGRS